MRAAPHFIIAGENVAKTSFKIKDIKSTLKSITHVINGFDAALDCFQKDSEFNAANVENLRNFINKEFDRLNAGLPTTMEVNHKFTKKDLTNK